MIAYAWTRRNTRVYRSTSDTSYSQYDGWDDTSTTVCWCEPEYDVQHYETRVRDEDKEDPFLQHIEYQRHRKRCKRGASSNLFGHGLVKVRQIRIVPYYKRRILRCNRKGIGLKR